MPTDADSVENQNAASSESEKPRKNVGGRPTGSRNKDKLQLQKRIQEHGRPIFARLLQLIRSHDENVALGAIKLALAYGYGKPPERLLIGNDGGRPFVVATPEPVTSFDDWQRLVKEAETIAANAAADNASTP